MTTIIVCMALDRKKGEEQEEQDNGNGNENNKNNYFKSAPLPLKKRRMGLLCM